jgi:hypothetical protein
MFVRPQAIGSQGKSLGSDNAKALGETSRFSKMNASASHIASAK